VREGAHCVRQKLGGKCSAEHHLVAPFRRPANSQSYSAHCARANAHHPAGQPRGAAKREHVRCLSIAWHAEQAPFNQHTRLSACALRRSSSALLRSSSFSRPLQVRLGGDGRPQGAHGSAKQQLLCALCQPVRCSGTHAGRESRRGGDQRCRRPVNVPSRVEDRGATDASRDVGQQRSCVGLQLLQAVHAQSERHQQQSAADADKRAHAASQDSQRQRQQWTPLCAARVRAAPPPLPANGRTAAASDD